MYLIKRAMSPVSVCSGFGRTVADLLEVRFGLVGEKISQTRLLTVFSLEKVLEIARTDSRIDQRGKRWVGRYLHGDTVVQESGSVLDPFR